MFLFSLLCLSIILFFVFFVCLELCFWGGEAKLCDTEIVFMELFNRFSKGEALDGGKIGIVLIIFHSSMLECYITSKEGYLSQRRMLNKLINIIKLVLLSPVSSTAVTGAIRWPLSCAIECFWIICICWLFCLGVVLWSLPLFLFIVSTRL